MPLACALPIAPSHSASCAPSPPRPWHSPPVMSSHLALTTPLLIAPLRASLAHPQPVVVHGLSSFAIVHNEAPEIPYNLTGTDFPLVGQPFGGKAQGFGLSLEDDISLTQGVCPGTQGGGTLQERRCHHMQGGYFDRGNFFGGNFQICADISPPPEIVCAIRAISCSLGRRLTLFFCKGGTGPRVLHVGISLCASACPQIFLCILRIPKNDFVYPMCIPKDCFVYPLRIPRTVVPATVPPSCKSYGLDQATAGVETVLIWYLF